ncbi:MAG: rod shape-determining protein MreC [Flavobacteriaceae bacterium]
MQQIISYLLKKKELLLFLLLLSISLILTIQSHSYHRSKFINSANNVTGGVYEYINHVNEFIHLDEYNERLLKENARLRKQLSNGSFHSATEFPNDVPYELIPAKLIQNSFDKKENILVINRGKKHGIAPDMGVMTTNGIIGVVESVGENYATVLSILHTESRVNAQLKKTNHIGSLVWNGESMFKIQLEDITKIAPIQVNDTIVTGNYSLFPQGVDIGLVIKAELDQSENFYEVDIAPFNDMSNIGYVYVVKNKAKKEVEELLNTTVNE